MGQAFYELALGEDEDDQDREGAEGGGRELDVPHGSAVRVDVLAEGLGDGELVLAGEENDRFQVGVPAVTSQIDPTVTATVAVTVG